MSTRCWCTGHGTLNKLLQSASTQGTLSTRGRCLSYRVGVSRSSPWITQYVEYEPHSIEPALSAPALRRVPTTGLSSTQLRLENLYPYGSVAAILLTMDSQTSGRDKEVWAVSPISTGTITFCRFALASKSIPSPANPLRLFLPYRSLLNLSIWKLLLLLLAIGRSFRALAT